MKYEQGDIVKIPFVYSDDTGSKSRPAIIVSNSCLDCVDEMIFVQVTSVPRNDNFSFPLLTADLAIPFPPNLNKPCQARCHRISAIHKSKIEKKIAKLKSEKLKELVNRVVALIKAETA
jgi:mRNA-degrading endonuclease toxin of MazEF toxin-antitoxin module